MPTIDFKHVLKHVPKHRYSPAYSASNLIVCYASCNSMSPHYSWPIDRIHLLQLRSGRLVVLASKYHQPRAPTSSNAIDTASELIEIMRGSICKRID